jgi:hypothetical protein
MMTVVNRICPELSDIVAVRLECTKCGSAVSYQKTDWTPAYLKCPNANCGAILVPGSSSDMSEELRALDELASGLRRMLNHGARFSFRLRLEFDRQV